MMKSTVKVVLPVAIAIALSACGSSDSSPPNTGGVVSSGVITGFGSIFVNGVEFETSTASFNVDGVSGSQADLAIGMKVDVKGSINADGVTGSATHVEFDEELQGPVSGITAAGGQTRSFTVLGTTVIIDTNDTRFDDENSTFSFATIENNDNVEISGFFNAAGELLATRVELEDADFDANSIVEIKGVIAGLSGNLFMISFMNMNNIEVEVSATTQLDGLPGGLVDGTRVEVKGTFDTNNNRLIATKIEAKNDELEDSDNKIEIEGIITRYISDSDFDVDGHRVDASSTTVKREPLSLTLTEGMHIEVEGVVTNGVLIVSEMKTRGVER